MFFSDLAFTAIANTATLVFHIVAILACLKYLFKK